MPLSWGSSKPPAVSRGMSADSASSARAISVHAEPCRGTPRRPASTNYCRKLRKLDYGPTDLSAVNATRELIGYCALDEPTLELLEMPRTELKLSARAYDRLWTAPLRTLPTPRRFPQSTSPKRSSSAPSPYTFVLLPIGGLSAFGFGSVQGKRTNR